MHPLDPRYRHIYAYCQKHGLPILIHMATTFSSGTPLEYARPAHMDQVAIDFPDLKLVLAHLGHPWEGETIAVIRRNANVFADLSALYYRPWQFYNSMRLLIEYRAEHKVLFGSDFPFTTTGDSLRGVTNVNGILAASGLPLVPSEVIDGIIHRDALALAGIRASEGGPMTLPTNMRALQFQEINRLVEVQLPVPRPKPGELLVRTVATTICTSDLNDIAHNPFGMALPRVMGHEGAGVVAALGEGVNHFHIGDGVAAHPVIPCRRL